MKNNLSGKKSIKPFNHTPASSFFRLACRVDFMDDKDTLPDAEKALKALDQLKDYARSLKEKTKKRTHTVRGRRKSIERLEKPVFKRMSSYIYYAIAIDIEKILERHYQLKSGETYVVLSKAALRFYETVSKRFVSIPCTATMKKAKREN